MGFIELHNINKSFLSDNRPSMIKILANRAKRTLVLKDIGFEVDAGEILGIIGRNGVGKSTLLRVIGGVYEKDSGRILTKGDIVSIFELGSFFNLELTGERYCVDYMRFRGVSEGKLKEVINSVYEFSELGDYFYQPIKTYSSGMQARLLFGVATALPAQIILIDEFLIVGDEYFKGKAWDRLRNFIESGTTGIIVSHDWVSLMKLCKRSILLSNNGIEFAGETYQVVQKYLRIPWVSSDQLRFRNVDIMVNQPIIVNPDQNFQYKFQVEVLDKFNEDSFAVGFSIERYQEGLGWCLALTGYSVIKVEQRKIIDITIDITDFCLAPGEYLLCLFLSVPLKPGHTSIEKGYEALTWLNGHPVKLLVRGENQSKQLFRRKIIWEIAG